MNDCPHCNTRMRYLYENRGFMEIEEGCATCGHKALAVATPRKKRR